MSEIPTKKKAHKLMPKQFMALSLESRNHISRLAVRLPVLIKARVRVVRVQRALPGRKHRDTARNFVQTR
jgi:hypothetical protein